MRRPHVYTTDALILKRMDYGEADRILTLFTPGRGKIKAIAKGARRTTSRIAGHVELFTRSQLQLSAGRDLEIVTQGESREHFPHLRAGLWHATTAFYLAELIDKFTDEHNEYAGLYTLLIESLRRLDEDAARTAGQAAISYRSRAWQMLRYFEIQLLDDLGYRPSLHECAACGSTLQPVENGFNATLGGVLCPNCSRYSQRPISLASLKVLRLLQTTPWEHLPRLRLDSSQQNEIEYLLQALIRFHLERDLKSWDFLRHIQPVQ
ncbi:MAG TPA: DNA repair protein RecO [Ktedonobacterales bacterium]|nr:DNA repair protein RecO [Ktedonobacterales bacterium]